MYETDRSWKLGLILKFYRKTELNFEFILISLQSGLLNKMKKLLSLVSASVLPPNSLLFFCCEKGAHRQASILKTSS